MMVFFERAYMVECKQKPQEISGLLSVPNEAKLSFSVLLETSFFQFTLEKACALNAFRSTQPIISSISQSVSQTCSFSTASLGILLYYLPPGNLLGKPLLLSFVKGENKAGRVFPLCQIVRFLCYISSQYTSVYRL